MKPARLTISLPKPCSENWDEMTPTEKGRFCASCQKEVINFTTLTDGEILAFFKASDYKPVCGRAFHAQLNRELAETKRRNTFSAMLLKRMAALVLFFQTMVTTAWAQTKKPDTTQLAATRQQDEKKGAEPLMITGRVEEYYSKRKLAGVRIGIVGIGIITKTDDSGCFELALPDGFDLPYFMIRVSGIPHSGDMLTKNVRMDDVRHGNEIVIYQNKDEYKTDWSDGGLIMPSRVTRQNKAGAK